MDFQIVRILVLMLVPFSLAQSPVNNTYYPPKANIAIYMDATDMMALGMEKELLKRLVTNWTNPERIALLDSGTMWNIKRCGTFNFITDLTTAIDAVTPPQTSGLLNGTSVEIGLPLIVTNCPYPDTTNYTTKLYILYFVTKNIQIGNETNVKSMSDNYNQHGRLTFIAMTNDTTALNRVASHVIQWTNYVNGSGNYPDNWQQLFYDAVAGGSSGMKLSWMIFVMPFVFLFKNF